MVYVLSNTKVDGAQNIPLIKTVLLDVEYDFSDIDAFVFTSKNAVCALDKIYPIWINKPSIVIGKATENAVNTAGGKVLYCSESSYGESLGSEIYEQFGHLKLLHPRAKVIAFDLTGMLSKNSVNIRDIVVYETICSDEYYITPEDSSVIIFSSPSTVECFFKKFAWNISYKAVAIGKTTAACIPQGVEFFVSPEQTLEAAIKLAQTLN